LKFYIPCILALAYTFNWTKKQMYNFLSVRILESYSHMFRQSYTNLELKKTGMFFSLKMVH